MRSPLAPLLLLAGAAHAQAVHLSGEISTAVGVAVRACAAGDCPTPEYQNRNRLRLSLDAQPSAGTAARGTLEIRNRSAPTVARVEGVSDPAEVQPVSLRVREAWVEGYDVALRGLDVRVGAQRVRWGAGDGYRPSDRLNAFDLEDPLRFDARLESPAVHAAYSRGGLRAGLTWLPFFTPSLMASELFDLAGAAAGEGAVDLQGGVGGPTPTVRTVNARVRLPAQRLGAGAVGARLGWSGAHGDVALGYYRGRDTLPQIDGEVIPENFFQAGRTDLLITLRYPKLQAISTDGHLSVGRTTAWFDAAVVLPSRTTAYITASRLRDLERLRAIEEAPAEDLRGLTQDGRPYLTGLVGVDRRVGGVYLNAQYLHGFLTERQRADLHHYLLVGARWPADDAPVSVELRAVGETPQTLDAAGWMLQPRLQLRHADALVFALMGSVQGGDPGTTLGLFERLSEVRLEATAEF